MTYIFHVSSRFRLERLLITCTCTFYLESNILTVSNIKSNIAVFYNGTVRCYTKLVVIINRPIGGLWQHLKFDRHSPRLTAYLSRNSSII